MSTSRKTPAPIAGTSLERAFEIMGPSAHVFSAVERCFGVLYTTEQRRSFYPTVPFTEDTLRECWATHLLFPGFPLSLAEMRQKHPTLFHPLITWRDAEPFARDERVGLRWYLMRKEPVPGSLRHTRQEHLAMLAPNEEVPRACEVAYMVLLSRRLLLRDFSVRCYDRGHSGYHVFLGEAGYGGLHVRRYWFDPHCVGHLGLASMRKPDVALPAT